MSALAVPASHAPRESVLAVEPETNAMALPDSQARENFADKHFPVYLSAPPARPIKPLVANKLIGCVPGSAAQICPQSVKPRIGGQPPDDGKV